MLEAAEARASLPRWLFQQRRRAPCFCRDPVGAAPTIPRRSTARGMAPETPRDAAPSASPHREPVALFLPTRQPCRLPARGSRQVACGAGPQVQAGGPIQLAGLSNCAVPCIIALSDAFRQLPCQLPAPLWPTLRASCHRYGTAVWVCFVLDRPDVPSSSPWPPYSALLDVCPAPPAPRRHRRYPRQLAVPCLAVLIFATAIAITTGSRTRQPVPVPTISTQPWLPHAGSDGAWRSDTCGAGGCRMPYLPTLFSLPVPPGPPTAPEPTGLFATTATGLVGRLACST